MQDKPVLIAGGGIGGLACALGLAGNGIAVRVLEKSQELSEIGAGIQLGPNAFHAFDALGVGAAARELAVCVDDMRLMDGLSGQEICRIDLGPAFRTKFGNPYAVVHRGHLHSIFREACAAHPNIDIRTSCAVTGYAKVPGGVRAHLADQEDIEGAMLVGADGLWSQVRAQMIGDKVRVSGHSTYRSVVRAEDMPPDLRWNAPTLWAGPKCHIVHYPLDGGRAYNLVVTYHNAAPEPVAGAPVTHAEVARGFQHIAPLPRSLIEAGQDWKLWVLCDREPVGIWSDGPVTLLGDAAHPTLQYIAQGACMALEDAVCLADELGQEFSEQALQRYQARRAARTAKVTLISREIGTHVYHPDGMHAQLRNKIMGAKSQAEWHDTLSWLYGGSGLDNRV